MKEIKTEEPTGDKKNLRKVGEKKNTNFKTNLKRKCEVEIKWNKDVKNGE